MIKRLHVCDTDAFIDILDDSFTREFSHIGKKYGSGKWEMRLTYSVMRLLQMICGTVREVPDILAYYEGGKVLGVTKVVPYNSRKDHWYSEITAVRKNIQKKGLGTLLKEHTVEHYSPKARRLFGNVREENTTMLKVNSRVGYKPYMKKVLLTKEALTHVEVREVEGLRRFDHDERGVFSLYERRTPEDIRRIEDKNPGDFGYGNIMKLFLLLGRLRGERDKKFVIERDGKICAYFFFEKLWSTFENLEILLDPECGNLSEAVRFAVSKVSPDKNIISYVPEYRDFERKALLGSGFTAKEVYINMVIECGE